MHDFIFHEIKISFFLEQLMAVKLRVIRAVFLIMYKADQDKITMRTNDRTTEIFLNIDEYTFLATSAFRIDKRV